MKKKLIKAFIIEYLMSCFILLSVQLLVVDGNMNYQLLNIFIIYSFIRLIWIYFSYKVIVKELIELKKEDG